MSTKIFIAAGLLFFSLAASAQDDVEVADITLKIKGEEKLYYAFAKGDHVLFNLNETDGKELDEVEIVEYPDNLKLAVRKVSKVENKQLTIAKTAVYVFRFHVNEGDRRTCKVQIQRMPGSAATKDFKTAVTWVDKIDTIWKSETKNITSGYDTSYVQVSKREIIKSDTVVTELFNKTSLIKSGNYSYINIQLPANSYSPDSLHPTQTKEIVAWSYWLGTNKENYESVNNSAVPASAGYRALAELAVTGTSPFNHPSAGSTVKYSLITKPNEQPLDSGTVITASGRNSQLLQGEFQIQLYNEDGGDEILVDVKVVAVQVSKRWEDKEYTERRITPRYEPKVFTEPTVRSYQIPVPAQ